MASNERQIAREEKKRRSQRRVRIAIWFIILAVALGLIGMKVAEIDFSQLSQRFHGSGSAAITADAYPYNLDSSKNVHMTAQNDKLTVLTGVSVTVLNPTDASVNYAYNHGYANPIMKNAGNYICVFDQGANRLRLDTLSGDVYESKTENAILTADVNKSGDVIYATQSDENKSSVTVMDSKLKKVAELEVNSGYVVSVAIDASGKHFTYAVINSRDAVLTTTVYTCNVGDDAEKASFDFTDCDLLEMRYCQSDVYLVFSNGVYTVTSQKKLHPCEAFSEGSVNTVCHTFTASGELIYIYSEYSSSNENHLAHINTSGKVKTSIELTKLPKSVASSSNEITVLFNDSVAVYSLTRGEEKGTYKCEDSVSTAMKLSTKIFVCRHQLIDVIEG